MSKQTGPSVKTYSCKHCGTQNLHWYWDFRRHKPFLGHVAVNGSTERHSCPNGEGDIVAAECEYCHTKNKLFWVKRAGKNQFAPDRWELLEEYGLQHACQEKAIIHIAHKEALREDYAFEKARINSFAQDSVCPKCKGQTYRCYKRPKTGGFSVWPCKFCRQVGTFSTENKKYYLKRLRKKYWPYQHWMRG